MSFANQQPAAGSQPEGEAGAAPASESELRQQALHAVQRLRTCDARQCGLWVSTDLSTLTLRGPRLHPEDIVQGSKAFRRLSPDFFLWLESRFAAFRRKTSLSGQLALEAKAFTGRFQDIYRAAHEAFTPEDFAQAQKRLALFPMESPNKAGAGQASTSTFQFPAQSALPFRKTVTHHALAEVDFVRNEALRLGWTELELYSTRGPFTFPCGPGYGLICFVNAGRRVGPVSESHIELHCGSGAVQRFYRRRA